MKEMPASLRLSSRPSDSSTHYSRNADQMANQKFEEREASETGHTECRTVTNAVTGEEECCRLPGGVLVQQSPNKTLPSQKGLDANTVSLVYGTSRFQNFNSQHLGQVLGQTRKDPSCVTAPECEAFYPFYSNLQHPSPVGKTDIGSMGNEHYEGVSVTTRGKANAVISESQRLIDGRLRRSSLQGSEMPESSLSGMNGVLVDKENISAADALVGKPFSIPRSNVGGNEFGFLGEVVKKMDVKENNGSKSSVLDSNLGYSRKDTDLLRSKALMAGGGSLSMELTTERNEVQSSFTSTNPAVSPQSRERTERTGYPIGSGSPQYDGCIEESPQLEYFGSNFDHADTLTVSIGFSSPFLGPTVFTVPSSPSVVMFNRAQQQLHRTEEDRGFLCRREGSDMFGLSFPSEDGKKEASPLSFAADGIRDSSVGTESFSHVQDMAGGSLSLGNTPCLIGVPSLLLPTPRWSRVKQSASSTGGGKLESTTEEEEAAAASVLRDMDELRHSLNETFALDGSTTMCLDMAVGKEGARGLQASSPAVVPRRARDSTEDASLVSRKTLDHLRLEVSGHYDSDADHNTVSWGSAFHFHNMPHNRTTPSAAVHENGEGYTTLGTHGEIDGSPSSLLPSPVKSFPSVASPDPTAVPESLTFTSSSSASYNPPFPALKQFGQQERKQSDTLTFKTTGSINSTSNMVHFQSQTQKRSYLVEEPNIDSDVQVKENLSDRPSAEQMQTSLPHAEVCGILAENPSFCITQSVTGESKAGGRIATTNLNSVSSQPAVASESETLGLFQKSASATHASATALLRQNSNDLRDNLLRARDLFSASVTSIDTCLNEVAHAQVYGLRLEEPVEIYQGVRRRESMEGSRGGEASYYTRVHGALSNAVSCGTAGVNVLSPGYLDMIAEGRFASSKRPMMLAHPDEFRNPSSFLKIYGDPQCHNFQLQGQLSGAAAGGTSSGGRVHPKKSRDGNWECPACKNINYPRRFRCNNVKCKALRDSEGDRLVSEYARQVFHHYLFKYKGVCPLGGGDIPAVPSVSRGDGDSGAHVASGSCSSGVTVEPLSRRFSSVGNSRYKKSTGNFSSNTTQESRKGSSYSPAPGANRTSSTKDQQNAPPFGTHDPPPPGTTASFWCNKMRHSNLTETLPAASPLITGGTGQVSDPRSDRPYDTYVKNEAYGHQCLGGWGEPGQHSILAEELQEKQSRANLRREPQASSRSGHNFAEGAALHATDFSSRDTTALSVAPWNSASQELGEGNHQKWNRFVHDKSKLVSWPFTEGQVSSGQRGGGTVSEGRRKGSGGLQRGPPVKCDMVEPGSLLSGSLKHAFTLPSSPWRNLSLDTTAQNGGQSQPIIPRVATIGTSRSREMRLPKGGQADAYFAFCAGEGGY